MALVLWWSGFVIFWQGRVVGGILSHNRFDSYWRWSYGGVVFCIFSLTRLRHITLFDCAGEISYYDARFSVISWFALRE